MNYLDKILLDDTIVALATPDATSAIAIIRVSGRKAFELVNQLFTKKNLKEQATQTIHYGFIYSRSNEIIDEVMLSVFKGPKTYTGENLIEISCHGSPIIYKKIISELTQIGCRLARPGEFTFRAFIHGKLDLSQAESVIDIIHSNSESSLTLALNQLRGGISYELKKVKQELIQFLALIELELDFSEEDVAFANRSELLKRLTEIHSAINPLIESFKVGNSIKEGIPTVIAGKPNAGKSTLLNALLKEERAIVSDIPGTTRDTIEETFIIDGFAFRVSDTAGIREHTQDIIEAMGIQKTFEKLANAQVILYVFDPSITNADELVNEINSLKKETPLNIIAIANKIDILPDDNWVNHTETPFKIHKISSKKQLGIEALKALIAAPFQEQKREGASISSIRHYQALCRCSETLKQVELGIEQNIQTELLSIDIRQALFEINEISGEITNEDILSSIFSSFCIGK